MAVPIRYNIRNLKLRKGQTCMTILGVALTVAAVMFLAALRAGLNRAFVHTGDPLNVLVLGKGADSEIASDIPHEALQILRTLPGIATNSKGEPLVSGELVLVILLPREDGLSEANVTLRGTSAQGIELRPGARLVRGRWFNPGQRELAVGAALQKRFARTAIGESVQFGKGPWKIVGVFDASGSAYDSEIWSDVNQITSDYTTAQPSSVYMRATDSAAADALKHRVSDDQRLQLDGMLETEYYAEQTKSGAPIKFVGLTVAIIMGIGSCFAAMNTMFAAVANRRREIGTLRLLGFSRASILASFVLESLLIVVIATALAILVVMPFNGIMTGTSNAATFSEVVFTLQMTPSVMGTALLFGLIMGLTGGFVPAWRAAHQSIVGALRA